MLCSHRARTSSLSYFPAGPLPVIEGVSAITQHNTGMSTMSSPKSPAPGFPPLTPADKAKFHNMFYRSGPVNGLLSGARAAQTSHQHTHIRTGEKARDIFLKSKLPTDKLMQIWYASAPSITAQIAEEVLWQDTCRHARPRCPGRDRLCHRHVLHSTCHVGSHFLHTLFPSPGSIPTSRRCCSASYWQCRYSYDRWWFPSAAFPDAKSVFNTAQHDGKPRCINP